MDISAKAISSRLRSFIYESILLKSDIYLEASIYISCLFIGF